MKYVPMGDPLPVYLTSSMGEEPSEMTLKTIVNKFASPVKPFISPGMAAT